MKSIFLVQHMYEYGDELEHEECKIIGVYSSREKAEVVINHYILLPGFRDYPKECFYIDEYVIDRDYWEEGFFKIL